MQSERASVKRLTSIKNSVSAHYLINRKGDIIKMIDEKNIAWHAGKSKWKNFINLNRESIGIEIVNKGHKFGYEKFTKAQISKIILLCKILMKKYKIKKANILGHSDIAPLRKKDPGEKFPWQFLSKYHIGVWHSIDKRLLKKNRLKIVNDSEKKLFLNYLLKIGYFFKKNKIDSIFSAVKAFQRRFRPEYINGKIDMECLVIAKNLVKSGFN